MYITISFTICIKIKKIKFKFYSSLKIKNNDFTTTVTVFNLKNGDSLPESYWKQIGYSIREFSMKK